MEKKSHWYVGVAHFALLPAVPPKEGAGPAAVGPQEGTPTEMWDWAPCPLCIPSPANMTWHFSRMLCPTLALSVLAASCTLHPSLQSLLYCGKSSRVSGQGQEKEVLQRRRYRGDEPPGPSRHPARVTPSSPSLSHPGGDPALLQLHCLGSAHTYTGCITDPAPQS